MRLFQFKDWKMSTKLVAFSLLIGAGSILSVGWLGVSSGSKALLTQKAQALEAVGAARAQYIEGYFNIINEQMFTFAEDEMIVDATVAFSEAFENITTEVEADTANGSAVHQSVLGYYNQEFQPRTVAAGRSWPGGDFWVPESPQGRLLQSMYISNNPHDVGDKLSLDRAETDCAYNEHHAHYHHVIRDYLNSFGYYDIFLFDLEGNLVYSVFKETDYATNFITGPYRDTNFADVYRSARQSSTPGSITIRDFEPYSASYGAPASFIGSPVYEDGTKVGVAIFQMPVDRINDIMASGAGMGETGQTYLVASDRRMRSSSRFSEDSTIFVQQVDTDAVIAGISGQSGSMEQTTYDGTTTLAAYQPLDVNGMEWVLISEMGLDEIMAPVNSLRNTVAMTGVAVGIGVIFLALFLARSMVRPLHQLVSACQEMATGNLQARVDIHTGDEIGQVGDSFNTFVEQLHGTILEIKGGTDRIDGGSSVVTSACESLASGATEQAASLQQITTSIEEISGMTGQNAEHATEASKISGEASSSAERGRDEMSRMTDAMDEIMTSSDEIGNVIKVIDDIAFQTNLLALNAAVEAARAGEVGKGFAVVAEEVRSLAQRSAEAAKNTSDMIHASSDRAQNGVSIAKVVSEVFNDIVSGTTKVNTLLSEIATASRDQADGIGQVNRGMSELDKVTQQNAGNSEELASTASETSTQARTLTSLVSRFQVEEGHAA